ncbi:MAG: hypothetical protein U0841_16005 [Chloroflexia bacterium]
MSPSRSARRWPLPRQFTHAGLAALTHTPNPMGFLSILERPRNERAYVVIPVGYPAPDATVPTHALEKKP